jgi:hypothetical protein
MRASAGCTTTKSTADVTSGATTTVAVDFMAAAAMGMM